MLTVTCKAVPNPPLASQTSFLLPPSATVIQPPVLAARGPCVERGQVHDCWSHTVINGATSTLRGPGLDDGLDGRTGRSLAIFSLLCPACSFPRELLPSLACFGSLPTCRIPWPCFSSLELLTTLFIFLICLLCLPAPRAGSVRAEIFNVLFTTVSLVPKTLLSTRRCLREQLDEGGDATLDTVVRGDLSEGLALKLRSVSVSCCCCNKVLQT